MAVETTTRKVTQTMNELITEYTFTFRALAGSPADIKCIRETIADGTLEDMTYVADLPEDPTEADALKYTVEVNDDGVGGTITVAYTADGVNDDTFKITIYRETTQTQGSVYDDYNQFPADTVEKDFDRGMMLIQEIEETLARTLTVPVNQDDADQLYEEVIQASSDAEAAATSATTAQTGAETAETNAGNHATTATEQAVIAETQATIATTKATEAATSATTATTKATEAATSATTAVEAKDAAEALYGDLTAVEAAKDDAEAAAVTATTQATIAEGHAGDASDSATTALTHSTTAQGHSEDADSYSTIASGHSIDAESYSTISQNAAEKITIEEKATDYTLALTDAGKLIDANSSSTITITVPSSGSVAFDTGTVVMIRQKGEGQVIVATSSTVTIDTPETLKLRDQHSVAALVKADTDTWFITGRLEDA